MRNFILLLAASGAALAQQFTISTVAGGAPPPTPVVATSASIGQPARVAVDSAGNVYFSSANTVFKMDGSGVLTVVAGNSRAGFSGDGGPAVSAQLNAPRGIAIDKAGDIFIADSGNNRVREVTPDGIINTFAGSGLPNPGGLGSYGDGGPAVNALLRLPAGVALDNSGDLFIADTGDNLIRKVTPDGVINSVAGDGYPSYYGDGGPATQAELYNPQDVAVDSSGNIYIADTTNAYIRKVTTDGAINAIAGSGSIGSTGDGGPATKASLNAPMALALDSSGDIYFVENGDSKIREIDTKGNINTVAGTGTAGFAGDGGKATSAQFNSPTGIALDSSGNMYIADSLNERIRKIAGSNVSTVAGNGILSYSGDGGPATRAQLNAPQGVAVDPSGDLYISDTANNVVRMVGKDGNISTVVSSSAKLNGPQGLAADSAGNLYIADSLNGRVLQLTPGGSLNTVAGNSQLILPTAVAVDKAGDVYIADFSGNRIYKVAPGGGVSTVAGTGGMGYGGDGGPAANAQLTTPAAVAVDASGRLYIADTGNNAVRVVDSAGQISTLAQVDSPEAIAVDAKSNVYVADGSAQVFQVYPSGLVVAIAGTGARGYSGDGGAALSALLSAPSALAVDSSGRIYVADTANNAVRLLQFSGYGLSVSSVTSAASNATGPIAPGEAVVLYGSGLGPSQLATFQLDSSGLVPAALAGTSVYFNGAAGPMLYTSNGQVAAMVPYSITGNSAQVMVKYQGQVTGTITVPVAAAAPALFTLNSSGSGEASAINQDGTLNGPSNPANAGTVVSLYGTGFGQTTPPGVDGQPNAVPLPLPLFDVKATVGGQPATVQFAGGAPGIVAGVMQVNIVIPNGVAAGNAPVVVAVGGANTQSGVTIAVQP